jgi:hypothetical protein
VLPLLLALFLQQKDQQVLPENLDWMLLVPEQLELLR